MNAVSKETDAEIDEDVEADAIMRSMYGDSADATQRNRIYRFLAHQRTVRAALRASGNEGRGQEGGRDAEAPKAGEVEAVLKACGYGRDLLARRLGVCSQADHPKAVADVVAVDAFMARAALRASGNSIF